MTLNRYIIQFFFGFVLMCTLSDNASGFNLFRQKTALPKPSLDNYPALTEESVRVKMSAQLDLFYELEAEGKLKEAASALEQLIDYEWTVEADKMFLLIRLARLYSRADTPDRAIVLLENIESQINEKNPLYPELLFALGQAAVEGDKPAKGLDTFIKLAYGFSTSEAGQRAFLELARFYAERQEYTLAWDHYDQYLATYLGRKNRTEVMMECVNMALDAGWSDKANETARQLWGEIWRYPEAARSAIQLARYFRNHDDIDNAEWFAAEGAKIKDEYGQQAAIFFGNLKFNATNEQAAVSAYQNALNDYPLSKSTLTAYRKVASILVPKEMLPNIDNVDLPDENVLSQLLLLLHGKTAEKLEQYGVAVEILESLTLTKKKDLYARALSLVRCYDAMGNRKLEEKDTSAAYEFFVQAIDVRPLNSQSIRAFKSVIRLIPSDQKAEWTQNVMQLANDSGKYSSGIVECWFNYLIEHDYSEDAQILLNNVVKSGGKISDELRFMQFSLMTESTSPTVVYETGLPLLKTTLSVTKKNKIRARVAAALINQDRFVDACELVVNAKLSSSQNKDIQECYRKRFEAILNTGDAVAIEEVNEFVKNCIIAEHNPDVVIGWLHVLLENNDGQQALAIMENIESTDALAQTGLLSEYIAALFESGADEIAYTKGAALLSAENLSEDTQKELRYLLASYLLAEEKFEAAWTYVDSEPILSKTQQKTIQKQIEAQLLVLVDTEDAIVYNKAQLYFKYGRLSETLYAKLLFKVASGLVAQRKLEETWVLLEDAAYPLSKKQQKALEKQIEIQAVSLINGEDKDTMLSWAPLYLASGHLSDGVAGELVYAVASHYIEINDFNSAGSTLEKLTLKKTQLKQIKKLLKEKSTEILHAQDIDQLMSISVLAQILTLDDTYYDRFVGDILDTLSSDKATQTMAVQFAVKLGDQLGAIGQARLKKLAVLAQEQGEIGAATQLLNQFLTIYPNTSDWLSVTKKLVDCQLAQQEEAAAWQLVEENLALFENIEDAIEFAKDMNKHFAGRASKYVESLNSYILMNAVNEEDIYKAHKNLGDYYLKLQSYDKAVIHMEQAFGRSAGFPISQQILLGRDLLKASLAAGYEQEYIDYLSSGIQQIIDAIEDPAVLAKSAHQLGKVYQEMGMYENARQLFRDVAELNEENGSSQTALYNLARSYEETGETEEAINTYIEYIEKYKNSDEKRWTNIAMANLLALTTEYGDDILINEMRQKAEAMLNGVDDPQLALDLAQYYGRKGQPDIQALLLDYALGDAAETIEDTSDIETGQKQLNNTVKRLMKQGYYAEAEALGEKYEEVALSDDVENQTESLYEAQYERIRAMLKQRKYNTTELGNLTKQFLDKAKEHGYSEAEADFLYLLTKTAKGNKRWDYHEQLVEQHPNHGHSFVSKIKLAARNYQLGNKEKAIALSQDALAQAADPFYARYEDKHRYNAMYIMAVLLQEESRMDEAQILLDELSYYSEQDRGLYVKGIMDGSDKYP
ncbi:MAG: tetratricopeptide repeat protein [Verrucomicrobiae bacterium]|nr:tetratricopeptide repeat protein [Verrucomicrobiae bacterium]